MKVKNIILSLAMTKFTCPHGKYLTFASSMKAKEEFCKD